VPDINGGLLFLGTLSVILAIILGYVVHEQGDYRIHYFNWFLMREPGEKPAAKPRQPNHAYNRRDGV
jgi:hypothetical protein